MSEMNVPALRDRLHDGLCQQLTGALMFARVLSDTLKNRDDALSGDAEILFRMVNDAADEVHAIMQDLGTKSSRPH